jgi:general bacterial porin, GBP family
VKQKPYGRAALGMGLLALAGASHAQSSVTIYGIVDAAVQYVKYDHSVSPVAQAATGNLQASRWGFRGREDLGGGYSANFMMETSFNTYTGAGGGATLWTRGASVGLGSTQYGNIDFGYMYLPIYWTYLGSDVGTYGLATYSAIMSLEHTYTLGKSGTGGFFPNSVRYRTPNFNGLSSEIGYSFGAQNASGQTAAGRNMGANVIYSRDNLWLAYGFNHYQYYASTTTLTASAQISHVFSATYNFGPLILGGNYVYTKTTDGTNFFASAEMVNAKIPVGPGDVNLGVARRIENKDARALAYDIGYVYYFTKRTQLYAYAAYIQNNSKSTQGFGLLNPAYTTVTPGFKPWAFTAGLRTSF